ncbi:hypothetical protein [Nitrosomonas aestuarii]|nr:hypothetical protein [Nitrosomonas aestuarii]
MKAREDNYRETLGKCCHAVMSQPVITRQASFPALLIDGALGGCLKEYL